MKRPTATRSEFVVTGERDVALRTGGVVSLVMHDTNALSQTPEDRQFVDQLVALLDAYEQSIGRGELPEVG